MISSDIQSIILAAGHSSRFNTGITKQVAPICGQPMILFILKALEKLNIKKTVVVGFGAEEIKKEIEKAQIKDVAYSFQPKRKGTGDAVACSKEHWNKDNLLILNGDAPLIDSELLQELIDEHKKHNSDLTICSSFVCNPTGYGRIIQDNNQIKIVEQKDCTEEQKEINNINAGIYLISRALLEKLIDELPVSKASGEVYFTEIVRLAGELNKKIYVHQTNYDLVRGVDTIEALYEAEQIMRGKLIRKFMKAGVRFMFPATVHLDMNVEIGKGSIIGAGVQLFDETVIGENVNVGPYSIIEKSKIENEAVIKSHSVISNSILKNKSKVGPFAYLRNNTILEEDASIGSFVEVKKSKFDCKSKAKHLSYIGDTIVGKNVNIGAGVVVANYDGFSKHESQIHDDAFIGSNSLLIAPIKIGKNAIVAGGSVINKNVDENDLAIARSRQENKKEYALKLKTKNSKKDECNIIPAKTEEKQNSLSNKTSVVIDSFDVSNKTEKII